MPPPPRNRIPGGLSGGDERDPLFAIWQTGLGKAAVWTSDAHGRFVTPQPAWSEYTGQTGDEARDVGWANALHRDDRSAFHRDRRLAVHAHGHVDQLDDGDVVLGGDGDFDGTGTLALDGGNDGDIFMYARVNPEVEFDADVDIVFSSADFIDSDGVCHDPDDDGACDSYTLAGIGGALLRFGRLAIGNNFGSELLPLDLDFEATMAALEAERWLSHHGMGESPVLETAEAP